MFYACDISSGGSHMPSSSCKIKLFIFHVILSRLVWNLNFSTQHSTSLCHRHLSSSSCLPWVACGGELRRRNSGEDKENRVSERKNSIAIVTIINLPFISLSHRFVFFFCILLTLPQWHSSDHKFSSILLHLFFLVFFPRLNSSSADTQRFQVE